MNHSTSIHTVNNDTYNYTSKSRNSCCEETTENTLKQWQRQIHTHTHTYTHTITHTTTHSNLGWCSSCWKHKADCRRPREGMFGCQTTVAPELLGHQVLLVARQPELWHVHNYIIYQSQLWKHTHFQSCRVSSDGFRRAVVHRTPLSGQLASYSKYLLPM